MKRPPKSPRIRPSRRQVVVTQKPKPRPGDRGAGKPLPQDW